MNPTTPEHVVARYLAHVAAHDTARALDCLADTFELRFGGTDHVMSKASLANALAWDAGVNGRLEWEVVDADESLVTIAGRETNDFLEAIGADDMTFRSSFEVADDGRILRQHHHVDWGSVPFDAALKPLVDWAERHEPQELAEIYPDRTIIYTRRMGERWVALARRWRHPR